MTAPAIARPTQRVPCPSIEPGTETVVTLVVNDRTVLAIARNMHDEKCSAGPACARRDGHAIDCFEGPVRKILGAMTAAYNAQDI